MYEDTRKMEECLEMILNEVDHRYYCLEDAIEGYANKEHGFDEVKQEMRYIFSLVESIRPLLRLRNYYNDMGQ